MPGCSTKLMLHPLHKSGLVLYKSPKDAVSKWVACGGYFKEFKYGLVQFSGEFMGTFLKYTVGLQYFTLTKV